MPKSWSKKEERQYARGTSKARAKEIAARTVQKQRREEGKTEKKTTGGTGNPNARLEDRAVAELRNRAKELDIEGRSRMIRKRS